MMADSREMKPLMPNFIIDRSKVLPADATIEIHFVHCGTTNKIDDEAVAVSVNASCAVTTNCSVDVHGLTFHLKTAEDKKECSIAFHDM